MDYVLHIISAYHMAFKLFDSTEATLDPPKAHCSML